VEGLGRKIRDVDFGLCKGVKNYEGDYVICYVRNMV